MLAGLATWTVHGENLTTVPELYTGTHEFAASLNPESPLRAHGRGVPLWLFGGWGGMRWAAGLHASWAPSASPQTARARASVSSCALRSVSTHAARAPLCRDSQGTHASATCASSLAWNHTAVPCPRCAGRLSPGVRVAFVTCMDLGALRPPVHTAAVGAGDLDAYADDGSVPESHVPGDGPGPGPGPGPGVEPLPLPAPAPRRR